MTDEQLVAYLDAAAERIPDLFTGEVEAVRMGWIYAQPGAQTQYSRWRRDADRRSGRAVVGTTLEQLAREYPDHVGLPN